MNPFKRYSMKVIDAGEDFKIIIKDHDEILRQIEKIKEFEKNYQEYDLSNNKPKDELIEVEDQLKEFSETNPKILKEQKREKFSFFNKFKKKESIVRPLNATVFHFRINKEKLENLDIKKPTIKNKKRRIFKFKIGKKEKGDSQKKAEKTSKLSKLKGGFSRIKKAIPSGRNKSEDVKETKE
jgi:hypothetical protein